MHTQTETDKHQDTNQERDRQQKQHIDRQRQRNTDRERETVVHAQTKYDRKIESVSTDLLTQFDFLPDLIPSVASVLKAPTRSTVRDNCENSKTGQTHKEQQRNNKRDIADDDSKYKFNSIEI